jgi:hypothetical protein
MSPKDALRKWNAENPTKAIAFSEGRGRLSRAAVDKCTELVGNGWSITGYATVNKPLSSTAVSQTVERVKVSNEKVIAEYVIKYDEKLYSAIDKTGKVWSMRNACNNCKVSLVQCHCDAPSIFGDIGVTIKRV